MAAPARARGRRRQRRRKVIGSLSSKVRRGHTLSSAAHILRDRAENASWPASPSRGRRRALLLAIELAQEFRLTLLGFVVTGDAMCTREKSGSYMTAREIITMLTAIKDAVKRMSEIPSILRDFSI